MKKMKIIKLLLILMLCNNVLAFEEIMIIYGKETKIDISSNHVNRLSFGSHYVKAIIGDESKYSALMQNNNSEIFITSSVKPPEIIHLSFILTDGQVVDVAATALDMGFPSIIEFVFEDSETKFEFEIDEATQMLRAMRCKEPSKYYVVHVNNPFYFDSCSELKLVEKERYRYEDYRGVVIDVSNKKKQHDFVSDMDKGKISKLLRGRYQSIQRIEFAPIFNQKGSIYAIYKERAR